MGGREEQERGFGLCNFTDEKEIANSNGFVLERIKVCIFPRQIRMFTVWIINEYHTNFHPCLHC